ncbi:MAG: signal peptidase I [Rhizobiales bacterium]|nr:signal peptidase I [Hyphomicrobiales bacterium]
MSAGLEADKSSSSGTIEFLKVIIHALILAFLVRIFLYQPFNIPSGSMKETLLVGDYLFVSKFSYGYSRYSFPFGYRIWDGRVLSGEPERGDVVVFKLPRDNETDYIKRVIGLPNDRIQVRRGQVFINGEPVEKVADGTFETVDETGRKVTVPRYRETLPNGVSYHVLDVVANGTFDNTSEYQVPEGHYFMMGDNRDQSLDSRATYRVGYVPHENLIGRAQVIFFSATEQWSVFEPWKWGSTIRWSRFFDLVD